MIHSITSNIRLASPRNLSFVAAAGLAGLLAACGGSGSSDYFSGGNLIVSRTVYSGTGATVAVGQALSGGGAAVADGFFGHGALLSGFPHSPFTRKLILPEATRLQPWTD